MEQIIIAIGREFGSGGHEIAEKVAKKLDLKLYDRNLLDHMADDKNLDADELKKYEEKPKNPFLSRRVRGYSNSMEENLAQMQFEYIREKGESGESFVIVGRCAEEVLRGNPNLISIYILADEADKVKRVEKKYELDEAFAKKKMLRHDYTRKLYHNTHSSVKWGHAGGYDLCINSSRLGIDGTVEEILNYIELRKRKEACKTC